MSNILGKKHNFLSLLKFTAPTIIMMVFMSLYTMVDGIFVSRFVGTGALSAVNVVYPLLSVVVAIGIMLGAGGSAVIATQMGGNKHQEAKESFSLLLLVGAILGLVILVGGLLFLEPLVRLLGANEAIYEYCKTYAFWLLLFTPLGMLQMMFQIFFVTAGKPAVGLIVTMAGGFANILLDYLFIVPLQMGIAGAAIATGIGFAIPAIFGLAYFALHRKGTLFFVRPRFNCRVLWESCGNGSSEMVTNLSMAVTTYLFNLIMMRYLGEDGVAAITIVLYAQYLLTAVYLGYSSGIAPIISYNYGNGNTEQLRRLFRVSILLIGAGSLVTFGASLTLADSIVGIFTQEGSVYAIALHGFLIFSISYLFIGTNIFTSSMFTAFSDGRVSAIISFMRTFVFLVASVLLLPQVLGIAGVWLAVPVAEALTLLISIAYLVVLRKKYGYA